MLLPRCSTLIWSTCLYLGLSHLWTVNCIDSSRDAYMQVKNGITTNSLAVNKIPPKVLPNENINIFMSFLPYQILFVNEAEMTVTVAASMAIEWDEPAFSWDGATTGVDMVSVSKHDIWTPVLVNGQSVDTDEILVELPPIFAVNCSGNIKSVSMTTMTVSCAFDMEWYPFDEQTCIFVFVPFNAESAAISTIGYDSTITESIQNWVKAEAEWTMEEVSFSQTQSVLRTSVNDSVYFTYVTFEVLMKRQSATFYTTNLIFPAMATAILTLVVFLIPPSSGEKVSYLVSIFISQTVFLSSVSNTMSKGDTGYCRFNAVLVAVTVKIMLAMAATIIVLRRNSQEEKEKQQRAAVTTSVACGGINYSSTSRDMVQHTSNKIDDVRANQDTNSFSLCHSTKVDEMELVDYTGQEMAGSMAREETPPPAYCAPSKVKVAFAAPPKDNVACSTPSNTKVNFSSVWKSIKKGERLSATALDLIFFVVFTIVSGATYGFLMHGK